MGSARFRSGHARSRRRSGVRTTESQPCGRRIPQDLSAALALGHRPSGVSQCVHMPRVPGGAAAGRRPHTGLRAPGGQAAGATSAPHACPPKALRCSHGRVGVEISGRPRRTCRLRVQRGPGRRSGSGARLSPYACSDRRPSQAGCGTSLCDEFAGEALPSRTICRDAPEEGPPSDRAGDSRRPPSGPVGSGDSI